jgi:hypothetical protein
MRIVLLSALLCGIAGGASAADISKPLQLEFGGGGVSVRGAIQGSRLAWMGMIRVPHTFHTEVRILHGFGEAVPENELVVSVEQADTSRGMWAFADVDHGAAAHANSPTMRTSGRAIEIHAVEGGDRVEIKSAAVEILYVRPRIGAWRFSVADGGGLDADLLPNGTIVMPLASMTALGGNPQVPASIQEGDLILVIDPRGLRSTSMEVAK